TTGQLLGLVSAETLLVVGFGTLLGFLVALPALLGIRSALTALVDRPVALMLPWPHLAAAVGACAVLALAAALASARLALRAATPAVGEDAVMTVLGAAVLPRRPPARLREVSQAADAAGLEDLWLWEDCFLESGVASAAAVLAWTMRLRVGIGLLPVALCNVA